ncbi:MAG: phosphatidate cytidylyltransferase [Bacteroidales bacterium]|nr:phosphatidate cytidylyltransferase [Bacteroidales bacterium]
MKNLWVRTLSGICFLGVVLGSLLVSPWLFGALQVFVLVAMLLEFYRMTMGTHYPLSRSFAILAGVTLFVLTFLVAMYPDRLSVKLIGVSILPLLGVMVGSLYTQDKTDFGLFSNLYTGLLYLAVPVSLSNLIVFKGGTFDGSLMLSFFILIWASDVGAYTFGMLLGRNGKKLFPSISPKKSWAGFWGGMVMAVAAVLILQATPLLPIPWYLAVPMAVLMHIAGVWGDLFESQWKRVCEVKDSGSIIPGHGGMMDRFDSAIFAMPVGTIYLIAVGLL